MDKETPGLLPNERTTMPDPEAVPPKVTTSDAFGGKPLPKDPPKDDKKQG